MKFLLHGSWSTRSSALQKLHKDHGPPKQNQQSNQETSDMSEEPRPGIITSFFRSTLGFRKTTLSLLVLLSYVASILITVYYEKRALTVPAPEPPLLHAAWIDLEEISRSPHPYDSHSNDDVHDYILQRVSKLAANSSYIDYVDDYDARSIFKQIDVFNSDNPTNQIIYFESGNVLVKIEGREPKLEGVLISAHYDSVPSAYGTTDDGMGIASMLGILEHYATSGEQPLRTIVFNFNNNEEFGLLGASVFFNHEWSKLVKYFINLEGTGAGGRAILFRATDNGIVSYFNTVRAPFGNSVVQEGFQSGLIRSETDYKIYQENGLRGVDIAFYKPRNLYHTRFDNIQGSSKGSLWHMLSNSLDLLQTLSNTEGISTDTSASAFFDVLGLFFFSISVDSLYIANVVLLAAVPIVNIVLLTIVAKRKTWFVGLSKGWLRFPISLVASSLAVLSAANFFDRFNPLVLTSDWLSVLVSFTALFVLVNYLIMNFLSWWIPVHDQKLIVFLELNLVLWMALAVATARQHLQQISGEYAVSIVYVLVSLSSTFGLLSLVFRSRPSRKLLTRRQRKPNYGSIEEANSAVTHTAQEDEQAANEQAAEAAAEEQDAQDTLIEEPEPIDTFESRIKAAALKSFSYDWSIQFLLFVPLTIFISYSLGEIALQGLRYSGQQSEAATVSTFKILSYFAISLGLPLLPFIHKLNFFLFAVVSVGFVIGTILALNQAPFNAHEPLTVSFVQTVDLTQDSTSSPAYIYGRNGYLEDIIKDLPSVGSASAKPVCEELADGRAVCHYEAPRPWLVDGTVKDNSFKKYLDIQVISNDNKEQVDGDKASPYAPLSADFKIWTPDNRNCVLNFNTSKYDSAKKASDKSLVSPVKKVKIYHDGNNYTAPNSSLTSRSFGGQRVVSEIDATESSGSYYDPVEDAHVFRLLKGIDNLQLHKVNFTSPYYHIGLEWIPNFDFDQVDGDTDTSTDLGVTVSCFWGEYEASSVIEQHGKFTPVRKLPAYDELLTFAPDYVSVSKIDKGLVKVVNHIDL